MAQNKSEKSPYQSRYGAGWITAAQWLAENMCARFARSQGEDLPNRFWTSPYWEKKFKLQMKHANELLREFSAEEIVTALRHPDARRIYSLGLKSVIVPILKEIQKKNKIQEKLQVKTEVEPLIVSAEGAKLRPSFSYKKNFLQKLRELDSG